MLKRAQAAGIKVITHEGPEQEGRDWNVELIDSVRFGEVQMQRLAKDMGEEGDYVVYVGTLTTPLHNKWADAAIAYQKEHYPKMKLVADRFPGADEIDTSYKTTLDVIKAYPNLKGILGFGSNGPIGAGNAVRQQRLAKKIAVVATVLPSQAKDLIADDIIREGFLWNPTDAGYAMVAVARLSCSTAREIKRAGVEIPGLGKAAVDVAGKQIKVDKIMRINHETIDGLDRRRFLSSGAPRAENHRPAAFGLIEIQPILTGAPSKRTSQERSDFSALRSSPGPCQTPPRAGSFPGLTSASHSRASGNPGRAAGAASSKPGFPHARE